MWIASADLPTPGVPETATIGYSVRRIRQQLLDPAHEFRAAAEVRDLERELVRHRPRLLDLLLRRGQPRVTGQDCLVEFAELGSRVQAELDTQPGLDERGDVMAAE